MGIFNREEEVKIPNKRTRFAFGEKTIFDLALHERVEIYADGPDAIRVPGGWIYRFNSADYSAPHVVFVPEQKN